MYSYTENRDTSTVYLYVCKLSYFKNVFVRLQVELLHWCIRTFARRATALVYSYAENKATALVYLTFTNRATASVYLTFTNRATALVYLTFTLTKNLMY